MKPNTSPVGFTPKNNNLPKDCRSVQHIRSRKNERPKSVKVGKEIGVTKKITKTQARTILTRIQSYMGVVLMLSAFFGAYLLATDQSLWKLAVSHAYGLLIIVAIDVLIGALNLFSIRKVYLPSIAWAILTIFLQLGDIFTAPQYKMTPAYFASYLLRLWAFDSLLVAQVVIVILGLFGRSYLKYQAKKQLTYFDMGIRNSRRDFLQIMGSIGILIAIAGIFGAVEALGPSQNSAPASSTTSNTISNLPSGAIANVNQLQVLSPVYFEYPAGYPNVLFKKSDGMVAALSMLCTHVCCECNYDPGSEKLYCPCHGSVFDDSGKVLQGPATGPLPSIQIRIDEFGNVFPTRVNGSGPCMQA